MDYLQDSIRKISSRIDWILFSASLLLVGAGLVTMNSFVASQNYFFEKQIIWVVLSVVVFFVLSFIDFRFLRRTSVIVALFIISALVLVLIFFLGNFVLGAQSRFDFGLFSIQPSDPIKLVVILLLAKYFSRRHVEIANVKHILVSGFYTFVLFLLVFLQPDFGSAIIIAFIWFGMVLVSGISKKHLLAVFMVGVIAFGGLWGYAFEDYQKQRILTFIHPLTDLQGTGYNAYQSTIAVGSGQVFGKGIGYGTQSKLQFLPEYETDFIFAAFAEEWGFVGVVIVLLLYFVVIWRIIRNAIHGATNFEILFGAGLAILFISHFIVHVGMNIGLLPVTGTTIPFLSYGGSHLLTEFVGLGILMGMRRYSRGTHKDDTKKEFLGV
ncbi:rod shape-determining protein RodA [bacterium]|jgi:rod shape determining protein RodA|nr:rod shape-determining protein RodA [bacterium]MBT3730232.1 rod shape-determining protein RodA [bacterium]MBT4894657.1 rod shape-determining protein RodA [bacterium]